jgi:biotin-(acetyl-CoA carboxylase) ligase
VAAGRAFDSLMGQPVRVIEPQHQWSGIAQGWNDDGRLQVRDSQGANHSLVSAEVSVRRQSGVSE